MQAAAWLVGGLLLLYFGAEWLVRGASRLAASFRVAPAIIGLTVVAWGTSAPEVVVGIQAGVQGAGDVALGNVLGSNVANVGLILGVTAMAQPPTIDGDLARRDVPAMAASALLVPIVLAVGLGPWTGGLLVLLGVLHTAVLVRAARAQAGAQAQLLEQPEVAPPARRVRLALLTALGLATLLLGGRVFVDAAVIIAERLGVSQRVIGLTVVAVGTSLPELAASLTAARRGEPEIAVGNVVGSNVSNVLLVLGATGISGARAHGVAPVLRDVAVMLAFTAAAVLVLRAGRRLGRAEGALLLTAYLGYVVVAARG